MKRKLLVVGLCAAASLLAQGPRGGRMGPGGPGPGGRGPGMMMPGMGQTVTGAPYSAIEVHETQQTLANGNVITSRSQSNVYRDGMGRVRAEIGTGETATAGANARAPRSMIMIHDPVAGVQRTLDPQNKVAREMSVRPGGGRGGNSAPSGRPAPNGRGPANGANRNAATRGPGSDPNTVSEDLPMQTINGVQATGRRVTRTIPAGQIGNSQSIQIVHEVWTSVDLKVPVMIRTSDPRSGTSTTQLTNILRSEPDASLFQVPAEYTVTRGGRGPGQRGGPGGGQIR